MKFTREEIGESPKIVKRYPELKAILSFKKFKQVEFLGYLGKMRRSSRWKIDGEEVIIKNFAFTPRMVLIQYLYTFFTAIDPTSPILLIDLSQRARMKREIDGRKVLSKLGIKASRILYSKPPHMIFEYIPGEDLRTIVERKEDYKRVAHLKGLEDATLHEAGYAYLDNKASNTIISDGEPFRVDLEFLSEMDKEGINRRLDLLTLFFSFPSEHWKVLDFWKKRGFVWSLSKKL